MTNKTLESTPRAARRAIRVPARLFGCVAIALTIFGLAQGVALAADADATAANLDNATCQSCHDGRKDIAVPGKDDEERALLPVLDEVFAKGVHSAMQCVACHTDIVDAQDSHQKGTLPAKDCAACHTDLWFDAQQQGIAKDKERLGIVAKNVEAYNLSFHARPNADDKSRPNAACHECHSTHSFNVPAKGTPEHGVWRATIPDMCGSACHEDHLEDFTGSVHGKEILEKANAKAAVCSDCHTTHEIINTSLTTFKLHTVDECGNCHEENLKTYRDSYHGKINKLGYAHTAKCSDCHGSHGILRIDDPESKVHLDNRLETCQTCHDGKKLPEATEGFVSFGAHAHAGDFEKYPQVWIASKFMIALLVGVFAFFWMHCILWFNREWQDRKAGKTKPHVKTGEMALPQKYVKRFAWGWRVAHLLFALSLMTLTLTGMSLMFAQTAWAPKVAALFGGAQAMGLVHRSAAIVFASIFVLHLIYVSINLWRKRKTFRWFGPDSLLPTWKDLDDVIGMFKWFFGKGERPQFERWAYYEKFDYWAPFWGVTIVGVSGFMMWFPHLIAEFLPGWVFNVAMLVHGEEAFLAVVFLFTVHFFNNHFRPDKLPPPDIVMFTGLQSLEEFKREHAAQYDRLVASGELEQYLVDAPSPQMTLGSKVLGLVLIAFGLILLALVAVGFFGGS